MMAIIHREAFQFLLVDSVLPAQGLQNDDISWRLHFALGVEGVVSAVCLSAVLGGPLS